MEIITRPAAAVSTVPADKIIGAMDPWTLCCAVGAENGTIGSSIGFDMWLHLSRKNWIEAVKQKCGASESAIEGALRAFVSANKSKSYRTVLSEQSALRGQVSAPVLGPGESMTVSVPLKIQS